MHICATTLGLVGLVGASPLLDRRQVTPNYPPTQASKAFRLVLNVTDTARDLNPSVQNTYVSSIHVGAGLALVGQSPSSQDGRIFYQNGTSEEQRYARSTVITDSGTPPFPSGLRLVRDPASEYLSTAHVDGGPGDAGVGVTSFPEPYAFLYPQTWAACREALPYYGGKEFVVIKQAQTSVDESGAIHDNVPAGCAPLRLVPECAALNDLPEGSLASHEYALNVKCYANVRALVWSQYGP